MRTLIAAMAALALLATIRQAQDAPATKADKAGAEKAAAFFADAKADQKAEMKKLQPTSAEFKAIFDGEFAATAESVMSERFWGKLDSIFDILFPKTEDNRLEVFLATSDEIKEWKGDAKARFPSGLRRLAGKLKPGVTWAAIRSYKDGGPKGQVGFGLAFAAGRWVFLPMPWNVLREHTEDYTGEVDVPADSISLKYKGDKEGAESMLKLFLAKDADLDLLTDALRPRKKDVEAVYNDKAAAHYTAHYNTVYDNRPSIICPPENTELALWMFKTDDVIAWNAAAEEGLPGGYKKAKDYYKPGVTLVRFKFVKPGEKLGMAYDGLFYVNERWVFMPKPWQNLPK